MCPWKRASLVWAVTCLHPVRRTIGVSSNHRFPYPQKMKICRISSTPTVSMRILVVAQEVGGFPGLCVFDIREFETGIMDLVLTQPETTKPVRASFNLIQSSFLTRISKVAICRRGWFLRRRRSKDSPETQKYKRTYDPLKCFFPWG